MVDIGESDSEGVPTCLFCHRLKTNVEYRKTFQLTCAVCCSYVMLGWVVVQVGTALPDLQALVQVDLLTASWLFTAWAIGYTIGSLVSGVAYDRWNRLTYMASSTIGCALSSMFLPWSPSFPVMLAIRVATGIFCGAIDTGANTIVPSIWGNKAGQFMQALFLSYTVGGIISPLLTRPFMTVHDIEHTILGQENVDDFFNVSTRDLNVSSENGKENYHIHFAFIVTGVLTALTAVPYFIMFCSGGYDVKVDDKANAIAVKRKVSKYKTYIIIVFVCAVNVMYAATEDGLGAFLVSFSLYQLHWDKTRAVILLAMYWCASCLGGLIGIFVVRRLGLAKMTFIAFTIWMVSFLGALLCSQFEFYYLVWLFIPLSGMSMVVIIPNVISWTEAYVCNVSGKVSSLLMVSSGIGIATHPPVIGHLMEKYSIICFMYVLSTESLLCTLCFIFAYAILYCCSKDIHVPPSLDIGSDGHIDNAIDNEFNIDTPDLIEGQELLTSAHKSEAHSNKSSSFVRAKSTV